jgi:hypothetical protein
MLPLLLNISIYVNHLSGMAERPHLLSRMDSTAHLGHNFFISTSVSTLAYSLCWLMPNRYRMLPGMRLSTTK